MARLEAEHSASLRALQSELHSLQERLRAAERERESLATQHKSYSEQHSDRVRALEKVSSGSTNWVLIKASPHFFHSLLLFLFLLLLLLLLLSPPPGGGQAPAGEAGTPLTVCTGDRGSPCTDWGQRGGAGHTARGHVGGHETAAQ